MDSRLYSSERIAFFWQIRRRLSHAGGGPDFEGRARNNGSAAAMTNGAGSAPLNFNGRYSLASYAGGSFAQTNIGELLIFDRRLGDTERLGVETYLVDKWQARSAARTCLTAGFRTARIGHHQTSPRR